MKRIISAWVVVCLCVIHVQAIAACNNEVTGNKYTTEPISSILEKYEDIEKYERLAKKREFEKTNEYNERIKSISSIPVSAFSVELPIYNHYFIYNADDEKYTFDGIFVCGNGDKSDISLYEYDEMKNTHKEVNTYGISVHGMKKHVTNYRLSFYFYLKLESAKKYKNSMKVIAEVIPIKIKNQYTKLISFAGADGAIRAIETYNIRRFINVKIRKLYVIGMYDNELLAEIPF